MLVDLTKDLFCKEKYTGKIYKVTGIFLPLGKPSGKDLTIDTGEVDEWRSIDEIEIISNVE